MTQCAEQFNILLKDNQLMGIKSTTFQDNRVISLSRQVTLPHILCVCMCVRVSVCIEWCGSQGMTDQSIQASDIPPQPQMHHGPAV